MVTVSKRQASAFIGGISIVGGVVTLNGADLRVHWDDIAEHAIIEFLLAWAFGAVEVMLAIGRLQASLIYGFAEFATAGVRIWTLGPAQAVKASWRGIAYETFGPLAPFIVLGEMLIVLGGATYLVRRA